MHKIESRPNSMNNLYTPDSGTTVLIDYSSERKILEVEFDGGHVYQYLNVFPKLWKQYYEHIKNSKSSGEFINIHVKQKYRFRQL